MSAESSPIRQLHELIASHRHLEAQELAASWLQENHEYPASLVQFIRTVADGSCITNAPNKSRLQAPAQGADPGYQSWIQRRGNRLVPPQPAPDPLNGATPAFSFVVPVYKVSQAFLAACLEAMRQQTYQNWEACIVFADGENTENRLLIQDYTVSDQRFRFKSLSQNLGISENSNQALSMARGEFAVLLDHDDTIPTSALQHLYEAIQRQPDADFLYSDKDCLSEDGLHRLGPMFKPDWSPEILYSVNYLTHLCALRLSIVKQIQGFRSETDGAQDWDIFLRFTQKARRIVHIAAIDYHWRIHANSSSVSLDSKPYASQGQDYAVNDHLRRLKLPAIATRDAQSGFHIQWQFEAKPPLIVHACFLSPATNIEVSPTVDQPDLLERTLFDQACQLPSVLMTSHHWRPEPGSWNSARERLNAKLLTNLQEHQGGPGTPRQVLLFLSSALRDLPNGCLAELIGWTALHGDIGFCGALVLDSDERLLEAGLIISDGGRPHSPYRGKHLSDASPFPSPLWYRNWRAVSPICVAVDAEGFLNADGLPEAPDFEISFVRLCLHLHRQGLRGMTNPFARVVLTDASVYSDFGGEDGQGSTFEAEPYFNRQLKLENGMIQFATDSPSMQSWGE